MKLGENETKTLIIGYGNPLRGDDGVGWHAIRQLHDVHFERPCRLICCHQLLPEMVEHVVSAELVIFIDAAVDLPAAEIHCRMHTMPCNDLRIQSHDLTPDRLMCFACKQFGASPPVAIYSIGVGEIGYDEGLSPEIEAALPRLVERIANLVAWWEGRVRICPENAESPSHA